jgi:hypothetical protein
MAKSSSIPILQKLLIGQVNLKVGERGEKIGENVSEFNRLDFLFGQEEFCVLQIFSSGDFDILRVTRNK